MESMTAEKMMYDAQGNETFIDKEKYIELKIKNMPIMFGHKLADHLESIGFMRSGSGIYADGSRWYRFEVIAKHDSRNDIHDYFWN